MSREARIAAVVPAFNEEETIGEVVSALSHSPMIDEVIVVSDGSTDATLDVGRALGVKTLNLRRNRGKGTALAAGVAHTRAPILVFVDADILNLSGYLLQQLIDPVVEGGSAMNIGVRSRGWFIDALHRTTGPLLSGIRCLRREIFEAVPDGYLGGYRIEVALNWACRELDLKHSTTVLYRLKHRVKERKLGVVEGLAARAEMFFAVLRAFFELKLTHPPLGNRTGALLRSDPEIEQINF